jgi:hypothetical protein
MDRLSLCGKLVAFILLLLIALSAAHLTARIKLGNEHVALSRAALHVPLSGAAGEGVLCTYGRFWNLECTGDDERVAALGLSIRYLCAANPASQTMECADRNMVGAAAIVTALAAAIMVAVGWFGSQRLQDRSAAVHALARYTLCAAASLLLLWHLSRTIRTAFWIGTLDERIIATRPILAFTGSVIGYSLLIALAIVAMVGIASSAAAMARR